MTEDDTFDMLRRTPIEDLHVEYVIRQWEFYQHEDVYAEWLRHHGWKDKPFRTAGSAYLKRLLNE